MKRKGNIEPEPMSDDTKAMLAQKRKDKQAADTEDRVAKMKAQPVNDWRGRVLRRYTRRVLELHGRDRLEFMEAKPVGGLFR